MALAQTNRVCDLLARHHSNLGASGAIETVVIRTTGDAVQDRTLADIGGKQLFTKEVEEALIAGTVDLAVHSLKDVPTWLPDGLTIGCVLERDDPRDAWLCPSGASLDGLPAKALVGTASLRRQAQILHRRPDLEVAPIRGNAGTRMRKLSEGRFDATLLALSGLQRLAQLDMVTEVLTYDEMLPAVAQGAIGVECRMGDDAVLRLLEPLNHEPSNLCTRAERALLAKLDGSCRTPIAGLAEETGNGTVRLRGLVAAPDGTRLWRAEREGLISDAERIGDDAGAELLAGIGPFRHEF
jgi:hydroxymethylbilane synthase